MCALKPMLAAGLWAGLLSLPAVGAGLAPAKASGSLIGFVANGAGVAQMGATVLLFNRYDKLVERALTNDKGAFGFDTLVPDLYSVRVTLASFVPAVKQGILVQPGMRSFLAVNLASVLSSVELVYSAPGQGAIMNDDWKWVLRSSLATRPILRILPGIDISDPNEKSSGAIFSRTRGMLKLSAGDTGSMSVLGTGPDLATAFALATSVYGRNQVQVSGNVGYASQSGLPTAAFATSYSHDNSGGTGAEVQLRMRQLFLPVRAGGAFVSGQAQGAPALRTMSVGFRDSVRLTDNLEAQYGFSMESVQFLDRLNFLSPFARLSYDAGGFGLLELGYSSGLPPADLLGPANGPDGDLQRDLAALGMFPRVSRRDGRPRVQRIENLEVGYRKVFGSRTLSLGVYRERVRNSVLMASGDSALLRSDEVLPDLFTNSSLINAGNYGSYGYMASLTQNLGERFSATGAYGSGGVLITDGRTLLSNSPEELRRAIRTARRTWLMARVSGEAPGSGTRFAASYQWTDRTSLTPGHRYLMQDLQAEVGLNLQIRQPVPVLQILSGRLEASAELRNLLAQGYLPVSTSDGRRLVLMHSPRSFRGGLSFIF